MRYRLVSPESKSCKVRARGGRNRAAKRAVKHCTRLRVDRDYREEAGTVLVVGAVPLQEVTGWGGSALSVETLLLAHDAEPPPGALVPCVLCHT